MTPMKTLTVNGTEYTVTDEAAQTAIGDVSQLQTADKTNLTRAINSVLFHSAPAIVYTVAGASLEVSDAAQRHVVALSLLGKSTLSGTPNAETPATLSNLGSSDITLTLQGQNAQKQVAISTIPLRGIPVTANGNYTDESGKQWLCDEVDLVRGVYIRRIGQIVFDGTESFYKNSSNQFYYRGISANAAETCLCTHFKGTVKDAYLKRLNTVNCTSSIFWLCAEFADAAELESYLAAQYENGTPLMVHYVLSAPEETPLPDALLQQCNGLYTYHLYTKAENDAGAVMTLSYVVDLKSYIDSALAAAVYTESKETQQ